MTFHKAPGFVALLCAAQLALTAPSAPAAEPTGPARISVAYAGIPLKDALRRFQETSGLRLAYAEDLLAGAAPVTLKRENATAEKVLLEILRPHGLEAVLTDKNLAAVVPARSDLGMAKAFGRALTIGIRLGNKLDGAIVVGDEVRVPGWTAEDDADLALGLTDVIVSIVHFDENRPRNMVLSNGVPFGLDEPVAAIRALLRSADPAVRAGALLSLGRSRLLYPALYSEIEQGLSDPHPAVRAASAFLFASGLENGHWPGDTSSPTNAVAMLRKLSADPESGVRMAASFALIIGTLRDRAVDPDGKLLEAFLADRSAFVRQTPRILAMVEPRLLERIPDGPAKTQWLALNTDDGLQATLRDANPIARAVSFALAQILQLKQQSRNKATPRDRVADIWTEAELAKDPWMKTVHGLIAPALAGDYQVAIDTAVAAAGSDKPSHQAAALLSLGAGWTVLGRVRPQASASVKKPTLPKIPNLAPLTVRLASSTWLWARLSGIALDAALPFAGPMSATPLRPETLQAAADRQQAALRDPSEPVRLVALFALGFTAQAGVPCPPEPILAALRSRTPAEAALGATIASNAFAPEALLAEITSLLADPSCRGTVKSLLRQTWSSGAQRKQSPEAYGDFLATLQERVVAAHDPALEAALYEGIHYSGGELRKEFENRMIATGSLAALAATDIHHLQLGEEESRILLQRLGAAAADPGQRAVVIDVCSAYADRLMNQNDSRPGLLALLDQALIGEPADARAAAARVRALQTLFSSGRMWDQGARLPGNLAKALEQALASAGDPVPSAGAVALLITTLNALNSTMVEEDGKKKFVNREAWAANHPTLIQALDKAVQQVLAGPREEDKIQIWCELAGAGDPSAVAALAERILDGRVPDRMVSQVMYAASTNPDLLPPAFGPALLKLVRDPTQNIGRKLALLGGLNMRPGHAGWLAGVVEAVAWDETREPELRRTAMSQLIGGSAKEAVPALIQKVLKAYDSLPGEMIKSLPRLACDHLATPGAEDLLVRVIEDKRLRGEDGWGTISSFLSHLAHDRELNHLKAPDRLRQALDKLEKEWPAGQRSKFEFYAMPQLQELREKLDQQPGGPAKF